MSCSDEVTAASTLPLVARIPRPSRSSNRVLTEAERVAYTKVRDAIVEARAAGVPNEKMLDAVEGILRRRLDLGPRERRCGQPRRSSSRRVHRARAPGGPADDDPHEHDLTRRRIAVELRAATTCPRCASETSQQGLLRVCAACWSRNIAKLWERLP